MKSQGLKPCYTRTMGSWKVYARENGFEIAVSNFGKVRVRVGNDESVMPLTVAMAMLSSEVRQFLSSPDVMAWAYMSPNACGKASSAKRIAKGYCVFELRKAWVNQVMAHGLLSCEREAFILAREKFPD